MTFDRKPVLGVMGDFSGGGLSPEHSRDLSEKAFIDIDRDNWSSVFQKISPEVLLELPFCRSARFSDFEDLHPDEMVETIPSLSVLMEAREHLDNPGRMRQLLLKAGAGADLVDDSPSEEEPAAITEPDLLDAILEGRSMPSPRVIKPRESRNDPVLDRLIREIGESSADRTDYKKQERWRAAIDEEMGRRVGSVLHAPAFKRLEALWRALRRFLVFTDFADECRIRILDLPRKDLLKEGSGLAVLRRLVVDQEARTPGGDPFDLLLGDLTFDANLEDLELLEKIGEIALEGDLRFVAAAGESMITADQHEDAKVANRWREIRGAPFAGNIGLAFPRLLLRVPYGPDSEPLERFKFHESADENHYLWGNPAFAIAQAVADAFASGSDPAEFSDLSGLMIHVFKREGEIFQAGPTERLLTDSEIGDLVQKGFQAVAGVKGNDSARICSFQSVSGSGLFHPQAP
jgi:type VI secretion system protein ImpC